MFRSYLTSALRYLIRNKMHSLLNAICLSIGLACFVLIFLWVKDEISFDKFHSKHNRIFRVAALFSSESDKFHQAVTPPPLAPALKSDFPEIEDVVRIDKNDAVVVANDQRYPESGILFVDQAFFSMFDFRIKSGNEKLLLTAPYTIVVTESTARKYFGTTDVVGRDIKIFLYDPDGNGINYTITGVAEDCPENSHIQFTMLGSFKTIEAADPDAFSGNGWFLNGFYTYLLLKPHTAPIDLENKLPMFLEKYIGKQMKEWSIHYDYFLQPLTDIHLHSDLRYELTPSGRIEHVMTFSAVAIIVLVLACINYINLSTAQSTRRFKEVGVRKTMGALKKQLIIQSLVESCIVAVVSLIIAALWMELTKPLFESVAQKKITIYNLETVLMLLTIAVLTGAFSGMYPGILLSSFRPAIILKDNLRSGKTGVLIRKSLVVIQFVITILLVIGIFVIQSQFEFIRSKDLGFDQDRMVILRVNGSNEVINGYAPFADEIKTSRLGSAISRSNSMIAGGLSNAVATTEDSNGKRVNGTVFRLRVDHDYLETYNMKLLAGRNFAFDNAADSSKAFIVNQATVKAFGWKNADEAIGRSFSYGGIEGQIIGVVKDFHFNSLQHVIEPVCIYLLRDNFSRVAVKLESQNSIAQLEQVWKKHFPNSLFDYTFADTSLQEQYLAEQKLSDLFSAFAAISLIIACIGLFALVSFSVESKTKEIGIRKVLGATLTSIVRMVSFEFLVLVVIACVIAMPFAYYIMSQWLESFAYHTNIHASVFVFSALLSVLIAGITVVLRASAAASANPVEALRNE